MNFLTISFLTAGALAALIPIILHFLMKGKPKRVEFPAICFIRETISKNRRRYTFKHFFLLLLRGLLLVGLGLLLARPSFRANLFSGGSGPKAVSILASGQAPTAVALVIDTSLRMNRLENNRSQLDEAQEYALSILSRLPAQSEVAIIQSGSEQDSFQVDLLAARRTIQDLTTVSPARSLPDSISAAIRLLQNSKLTRRELFVITDKNAESWPIRQRENLLNFLHDLQKNNSSDQSELNIYLVDCQGNRPLSPAFANSSLLNSGLSVEMASANTSIRLDAELAHTGKAKDVSVELSLLPLSENFSKYNGASKNDLSKNDLSKKNSSEKNPSEKKSTGNQSADTRPTENPPAGNQMKENDSTGSTSGAKNSANVNSATTDEREKKVPLEKVPGKTDLTANEIRFFEQAQKKSVRAVSFPEGDSRRTASFQLSGLPQGFYQGALRFSSGDALAQDNIRWFTFEIRSDSKILIVAPDPVERKALFLQEALAPAELRKTGNAPFAPETISLNRFDKIASSELDQYQAIFILDPDRRIAAKMGDLLTFVRNGGGLAIFFGRQVTPAAWQNPTARELLGGKISQQVRVPDWNVHLSPRSYENGILAPFRSFSTGTEIPWSALSVGRYWHITDLSEQAIRLIDYSDGRPALYSQTLGNGSVLIGSFPISDLPDETPWNLIPAGDASWIFLVMMDGAARSLIAGRTFSLNYLAGEPVVLRTSGDKLPEKVRIALPDDQKIDLSAEKEKSRFLYPRTVQTGHYRIEIPADHQTAASSSSASRFPDGFSVNYAPNEFNLTQRPAEEIESFFPSQSARWISKDEDLESVRTRQRVGRELYPFLLLLLSGLFVFELIYSNRFYGK